MAEGGRLRIGELSRRVGVSPELLRAWEARYGLVRPERTPGGMRLYSAKDEQRVRLMRAHIAAGLSAAEAARLAKLDGTSAGGPGSAALERARVALEQSFEALDDGAAHSVLDELFRTTTLPIALAAVILPFLNRLGERWAASEVSVAQEHFASNVLGGRLRALSAGWGNGRGPRAVLACPPGEQHDLGLLCFGLALRERGWRITYLGGQTPLAEVARVADELAPDLVVLSAVTPTPFLAASDEIRALASRVRVALGGAGASEALASRLAAEPLCADAITAAAALDGLKPMG